ncbi:hypothetical protein AAE478_005198 [Parahypoxylon ruwenzoriense]
MSAAANAFQIFCRKTTMVKHQRRSHQRGIHSLEVDDFSSESDGGESPSTPRQAGLPWSTGHLTAGHPGMQGHTIQRAASFADFGQHVNDYNVQQQYGNSSSSSSSNQHRHSVSAGGAHEYHGEVVQQPHHVGVPMLHRTTSMPQHPYYVTEQNNPGVATMNTNPIQPYQMPRQQAERLSSEIPYTAAGMASSIQSSPSTFSVTASGRSPSVQDGFYTHQPPPQPAYTLGTTSPIVEQPMVQYGQHIHQPMQHSQSVPPQVSPTQHAHHQAQEQYQPPAAQPEEHWYSAVPYQAPVEVATIGQLPSFGSGIYDTWAMKPDYDDPTLQMPSARIDSM